jgi:hypothetical protein
MRRWRGSLSEDESIGEEYSHKGAKTQRGRDANDQKSKPNTKEFPNVRRTWGRRPASSLFFASLRLCVSIASR